ncbi:integrase catalytic domain-containing protein [Nitrospirillum amazonense]|uniref:integrase catalytic domain-containing protein n=1 Tax=Nitrospirillum amazonense TaxID=28077 RepID=UPI00241231E7|nr:transposase family protein [Nitrospirillum amazonense]MDG3442876.1 transposase family protein [Nitrospirillum amazonense]
MNHDLAFIKPGLSLYLDAEPMTVRSVGEGRVLMRSGTFLTPRTLTLERFNELHVLGRLVIPVEREAMAAAERARLISIAFAAFTPRQQSRARKLYEYVRAYDALPSGSRSRDALQAIMVVADRQDDRAPPGERSVRRWHAIWLKHGRSLPALIPLIERRGGRRSQLHPIAQSLMMAAIHEFLVVGNAPIVAAYRALNAAIERHNEQQAEQIPEVNRMTVYRTYWTLSRFTRVAMEKGRQAARRTFATVTRGMRPTRLNEIWEVDHTLLDIILYDERLNLLLGRPWITAIIDGYTRIVMGFYIGFEPPSYLSVMLALRHALSPKDYVRDLYPGIHFSYNTGGRCERFRTDRGREFTGESLLDALRLLFIDHDPCPAEQPWYKGRIERWFSTVKTRFVQTLPGNTVRARDRAHDPSKYACIGYKSFIGFFHQWLIDDYHQSLHAGLNMSPAMAWNLALAREGGMPPRPAPTAGELECLTGIAIECTPQRYGIKWKHLTWQTPRFAAIRSAQPKGTKIKVKVDPLDLVTVRFFDPLTETWQVAKSTDPDYTRDLTLYQHRLIVELARREARDQEAITVKELLYSRQKMVAEVTALNAKRIKDSKTMLRYCNPASDGMAGLIVDIADKMESLPGWLSDGDRPAAAAEPARSDPKTWETRAPMIAVDPSRSAL